MPDVVRIIFVFFHPATCEVWIPGRLVIDPCCHTCATGSPSGDLADFAKEGS